MTKVYLSDLEPEEVVERLNKGEMVYYEDSKGLHHSYKYIDGICVRYTDGEVDGYGRSIYSTGECYFEDDERALEDIQVGKWYKTRRGDSAVTTAQHGSWTEGYILINNVPVLASWNKNGLYYGTGTTDHRDLVEEVQL